MNLLTKTDVVILALGCLIILVPVYALAPLVVPYTSAIDLPAREVADSLPQEPARLSGQAQEDSAAQESTMPVAYQAQPSLDSSSSR